MTGVFITRNDPLQQLVTQVEPLVCEELIASMHEEKPRRRRKTSQAEGSQPVKTSLPAEAPEVNDLGEDA